MKNQRKISETAIATASLRALACYEADELVRCKDQMAVSFLPDNKTLMYEVDALATQEHKRIILQDNSVYCHKNIRYVSLDFEQEDLMNVLRNEGFNSIIC